GHMGRWLKHEPYKQFAEAPDGYDTKWGFHEPSSLCATDPRSIGLVNELLDELISYFSSDQINVGCDETDVGMVRTKELCKEKGTGRVYLDFLLKIYANVEKHGKVMQFWGDIIKAYPELIPELPENIIAMVWGYEPDHPFNTECPDAELVIPEIRHAADLVLFACNILEARLAAKDGEVKNIPAEQRKQLAKSLKKLIKEHESIWLKRNRIGGLSDSSGKMDELLKMLESNIIK
ncbi:unnamed protein product, partial [marine sediment metagenome]